MNSEQIRRLEDIIRGALAQDVTPAVSAVIDAMMLALRDIDPVHRKDELTTLLVSLSCLTGQVVQFGLRTMHEGKICEQCSSRMFADFSSGLGFTLEDVTIGNPPENGDADLEDIDIATVH